MFTFECKPAPKPPLPNQHTCFMTETGSEGCSLWHWHRLAHALYLNFFAQNDIHFEVHYSNGAKLCRGNYKVLLILIMLIWRHISSPKRELKEATGNFWPSFRWILCVCTTLEQCRALSSDPAGGFMGRLNHLAAVKKFPFHSQYGCTAWLSPAFHIEYENAGGWTVELASMTHNVGRSTKLQSPHHSTAEMCSGDGPTVHWRTTFRCPRATAENCDQQRREEMPEGEHHGCPVQKLSYLIICFERIRNVNTVKQRTSTSPTSQPDRQANFKVSLIACICLFFSAGSFVLGLLLLLFPLPPKMPSEKKRKCQNCRTFTVMVPFAHGDARRATQNIILR